MRRHPRLAQRRPDAGAARVVVVGVGFGGLATMAGLARAGAWVTLVDRNVYSTFQPLLYQVATGGLNPSDVAYPVRGLAHRYGARFRHGELAGIDAAARQVTLSDGGTLGYDCLILATGVSAAYYGVPGADKHSLGLYTRHDAVALRDQVMARLERLAAAPEDGAARDVSVTVVGGGAAPSWLARRGLGVHRVPLVAGPVPGRCCGSTAAAGLMRPWPRPPALTRHAGRSPAPRAGARVPACRLSGRPPRRPPSPAPAAVRRAARARPGARG